MRKRERHGMKRSGEYATWCAIKQRCGNPGSPAWEYYGGRGISICDEWRGSFAAFFAYVGERPANHSLDRINNDGNYEPGNVRWATHSEQAMNKRRGISIDLTGSTFGRLTPARRSIMQPNKWICKCDCGRTVEVVSHKLTIGKRVSCGCAARGKYALAPLTGV